MLVIAAKFNEKSEDDSGLRDPSDSGCAWVCFVNLERAGLGFHDLTTGEHFAECGWCDAVQSRP